MQEGPNQPSQAEQVKKDKQTSKKVRLWANTNVKNVAKADLQPRALIFLTVAAIAIPFFLTIALALAAKSFNVSLDFLKGNLGSSIFAIVSELLYLVIIVWCYKQKLVNWGRLGWKKVKPTKAIIYVVAGIGWYFLLTFTFSILVKVIFPDFNSNQQQDIGIQNLQGLGQQILAFVSLAIVPPIVEETLFRGFLFKGLRKKWPFWLSALITSFMFALAHGQLNVGLDVFALSLVLCYITDKTDSIIPGIIIHSLKNSLAYVLLFTHLFPMIH